MSRAQAQYLRLFNATGTLHRWQSHYGYRPVSWEGSEWIYQQFEVDGFTVGSGGDESSMVISAPLTSLVRGAFESAILSGDFADVRIYEFNGITGRVAPPPGQVAIASLTGQVVGGSQTATRITLQLGSALAPVGAQFPPRTLTTDIMGQGCIL
jgi:hypothetical protein